MLRAIGLQPDACHITTAVYWRPPGNRHPTPQELDVCQPFLERQVELVAPELMLLLGAAAARQVMDISDGIMRVRGKWRDVQMGKHSLRAIASLSPSYLIKSPLAKQNAWRDLLAIKSALGS
jgi:DNA polymerase